MNRELNLTDVGYIKPIHIYTDSNQNSTLCRTQKPDFDRMYIIGNPICEVTCPKCKFYGERVSYKRNDRLIFHYEFGDCAFCAIESLSELVNYLKVTTIFTQGYQSGVYYSNCLECTAIVKKYGKLR